MRRNLGSCSKSVWIMACVLQAASAVKLVGTTLWRVIINKRKESLEACLVAGRGGVLQANSVLTAHSTLNEPSTAVPAQTNSSSRGQTPSADAEITSIQAD